MVTSLLRDQPPGFDYRVILLYRDPGEVLASQQAMLGRLGGAGAKASNEQLKALFRKELERVSHGWPRSSMWASIAKWQAGLACKY